jgi:alpha-methylacyl-CoA racemase
MNTQSDLSALAGLTVLDLSTRLPGPLATLMLAQAGARVIKIERPPGEEFREYQPQVAGMSAHYAWLNRGKECLALDLKRADDRLEFDRLLAGADVLMEQFRPSVMTRLGLGYEQLSAKHPGLIYCAITGYGQRDPRSLTAAHDLNYQASAGLAGANPPTGQRNVPPMPSVLLGDIAGGTYPAVMSILLAVLHRRHTGRGQFLDIAMARNLEVFNFWATISGHLTGSWPQPGTTRHGGGSPRYNLYTALDGKVLAVAALEDRFWQDFLDGIGLPLPPDMEKKDPQGVIALVASRIATADAAEWLRRLEGKDACCNLVLGPDEVTAENRRHTGAPPATTNDQILPLIALPLAAQFDRNDAPMPAWRTE